ncbi:MAG: phosphatidylglycerophosphatase A, partial [Erysipelotrichaceae bacterium]
MYNHCVALLKERGVELVDIAECVMYLQKAYIKDITIEKCLVEIDSVLCKREVQNAITTGIYMDKQAEKHLIDDKCLSDLMLNDASLFGIDEVLAYGICNLYGSIALTNYGYIDKVKPLIVGKLNKD